MKTMQPNLNGLTLVPITSQVVDKGEVTVAQLSDLASFVQTTFQARPELAVRARTVKARTAKCFSGQRTRSAAARKSLKKPG